MKISPDLLCGSSKKITVSKPINRTAIIEVKSMLFSGDIFYPSGGWKDFKGYFDSVEEAKTFLFSQDLSLSWAHIVHNDKIIWKAITKDQLYNENWTTVWDEQEIQ